MLLKILVFPGLMDYRRVESQRASKGEKPEEGRLGSEHRAWPTRLRHVPQSARSPTEACLGTSRVLFRQFFPKSSQQFLL